VALAAVRDGLSLSLRVGFEAFPAVVGQGTEGDELRPAVRADSMHTVRYVGRDKTGSVVVKRASALMARERSTSGSHDYQPASPDSTNSMACSTSGVERYKFVSRFNSGESALQRPLTVPVQYNADRTVDLDSLLVCGVPGLQIVGHEYRVPFDTGHEPGCLSRIEMWIRRFGADIEPFHGTFEFGDIGRTTFEFVENGLRNEHLTSQFERRQRVRLG
jgi:hypothetical protein